MISKTFRVMLMAATCIGILAISTTPASNTSSDDQEQAGSNVLISNSGYMVAIG